jgi:hypothetical protein
MAALIIVPVRPLACWNAGCMRGLLMRRCLSEQRKFRYRRKQRVGGAPQIIEQEVTEETERPRFLRRVH